VLELDALVSELSATSLFDFSDVRALEVLDSGSVGERQKECKCRLDRDDAEEAKLDKEREEELEEELESFSEREELEEEREEKEDEFLDKLLMVKSGG